MAKIEITDEMRAFVNANGGPWKCNYSSLAVAVGISTIKASRVILRMRGETVKHEAAPERPETPAESTPEPVGDFDRGFGIGGLARYEEPPFVPTVEQMERLEAMEKRARRCRRCGQTDVFDGAMFTTDPSSGLCDDCYG